MKWGVPGSSCACPAGSPQALGALESGGSGVGCGKRLLRGLMVLAGSAHV